MFYALTFSSFRDSRPSKSQPLFRYVFSWLGAGGSYWCPPRARGRALCRSQIGIRGSSAVSHTRAHACANTIHIQNRKHTRTRIHTWDAPKLGRAGSKA